MYGALFGRRIIVAIGKTIVVNLDPAVPLEVNDARNLHVDFTAATHAKPEGLVASVTVKNLSRSRRAQLANQQDTARQQASQQYQAVLTGDILVEPDEVEGASANLVTQGATVKIWAGYQDSFGLIHAGVVLPDGYDDNPDAPGYSTSFRSQDTRLAWSNTFVSEEIAPGVTLVDYNKALRVAEQYKRGEIGGAEVEAQAPGLIERKLDVFGYENGKVLHGHSRDENAVLMNTLGLKAFLVNGQPYYLPVEATRYTQAVVLKLVSQDPSVAAPGGLLSYKKQGRFYMGKCLLNYRLSAGRQVRLLDASNNPVGGGLFRVEHAEHTGSSYTNSYHTEFVLRPVTVAPQDNL